MEIDFDIKNCEDIYKFIDDYIYYYNNERPSYKLNYKTPIQYRIESGFGEYRKVCVNFQLLMINFLILIIKLTKLYF